MKAFVLVLILAPWLLASSYAELSQKIVKDLNYIYQNRAYRGGSTFAKETKFKYQFRVISDHEVEILRSIDGVCQGEPFIIDLKEEFYVELEEDKKCNPSLIISHELDIIYLLVKDRCGHFGGFNLYKRAMDATVLLKEHFYEARKLKE